MIGALIRGVLWAALLVGYLLMVGYLVIFIIPFLWVAGAVLGLGLAGFVPIRGVLSLFVGVVRLGWAPIPLMVGVFAGGPRRRR